MWRQTAAPGPCPGESQGSCRCHPCQGIPFCLPGSNLFPDNSPNSPRPWVSQSSPSSLNFPHVQNGPSGARLLWPTLPLSHSASASRPGGTQLPPVPGRRGQEAQPSPTGGPSASKSRAQTRQGDATKPRRPPAKEARVHSGEEGSRVSQRSCLQHSPLG